MLIIQDYTLREMEESDVERVLTWRNREAIRRFMLTDHKISLEEHLEWFQKITREKSAIPLIFSYQNRPLGFMNFTQLDWRNRVCSWGFYIGEEKRPPKSGRIMGFLSIQYIFEQRSFRKLMGEVLRYNEKSIRLHRELGFHQEGILQQHILKGTRYEDLILFALFRQDWDKRKDQIKEALFGGEIQ